MKPPIELYRPTILNIIAILCYCLALLFHIIAYATNNWASLLLDGVRWRMGLFQGCTDINNTEYCTSIVFENKVFQTGSDWHLGARVMMTLALVLIFLLEFPLIAYACIKNLERYRNRLVGITLGLSISTAIFHLASLIVYNASLATISEARIRGSFGLVVISFLMEVSLPILICTDRSYRNKSKLLSSSTSTPGLHSAADNTALRKQKDGYSLFTIDDKSSSVRTSMTSLTEAEAFRKFVCGDLEEIDLNPLQSSLETSGTRVSYSQSTGESLV